MQRKSISPPKLPGEFAKSQSPAKENPREEFIKAGDFQGKKAGYYFSTGKNGTGYYLDPRQKAAPAPVEVEKAKGMNKFQGGNFIERMKAMQAQQEEEKKRKKAEDKAAAEKRKLDELDPIARKYLEDMEEKKRRTCGSGDKGIGAGAVK